VNNWKVIFATIIIFGTGVVTGGLLVNHVRSPEHRGNAHHAPVAATNAAAAANATNQPVHLPEVLSKPFLHKLDSLLTLSTNQYTAVEKTIGEGQNQMRKLMQDVRQRIREELTPAQRKQYDELVQPIHPAAAHHAAAATNAPDLMPATNGTAAGTNATRL